MDGEGVFYRFDGVPALSPSVFGMKLNFCNKALQHIPLFLPVQLIKNLVEHPEGLINILNGQILILNRLPALLTLLYLVLNLIDFIVELIQTAIHVPPLSLRIPVLVSNIINIAFQIGFAPIQLLP